MPLLAPNFVPQNDSIFGRHAAVTCSAALPRLESVSCRKPPRLKSEIFWARHMPGAGPPFLTPRHLARVFRQQLLLGNFVCHVSWVNLAGLLWQTKRCWPGPRTAAGVCIFCLKFRARFCTNGHAKVDPLWVPDFGPVGLKNGPVLGARFRTQNWGHFSAPYNNY